MILLYATWCIVIALNLWAAVKLIRIQARYGRLADRMDCEWAEFRMQVGQLNPDSIIQKLAERIKRPES